MRNYRGPANIGGRTSLSHFEETFLAWEVQMKILKGIVVGGVLAWAGQAVAEEDASSEIRALKTRLKQLEQRIENQGRQEKVEVQAKAAVKAAPSVFDPCPAGKVCYKGVTLTFGGWIDLAGIYRSRNL